MFCGVLVRYRHAAMSRRQGFHLLAGKQPAISCPAPSVRFDVALEACATSFGKGNSLPVVYAKISSASHV